MRRLDDNPIDPEIAAALDAIDATIAGEPVDPMYAELAELALLLTAERPEPGPEFERAMDARVARRFLAAPAVKQAPPRRRRGWVWSGWAAAVAAAAAVALVFVLAPGGGGTSGTSSANTSFSATATTAAPASSASSSAAGGVAAPAPAPRSGAPALRSVPAPAVQNGALNAQSTPAASLGLQPPATGRKVIQSAELYLSTPFSRVDDVSQEVYNVVGRVQGFVLHSSVTQTGGPDGEAYFTLSIPSSNLATAMAALSHLQYATVASRTDNVQDVNDQYNADQNALNDARALRTSLLKQLANATTQAQIDSLTAQLHDAEASIASRLATLRGLQAQINYSQISLTIGATGTPPVQHHHSTGGFTLGKAAHLAGRVLVVAAGVALIGAAALLPLALLVALGWWVGSAFRRRRREHALDMA
jgi:hypothetical protein